MPLCSASSSWPAPEPSEPKEPAKTGVWAASAGGAEGEERGGDEAGAATRGRTTPFGTARGRTGGGGAAEHGDEACRCPYMPCLHESLPARCCAIHAFAPRESNLSIELGPASVTQMSSELSTARPVGSAKVMPSASVICDSKGRAVAAEAEAARARRATSVRAKGAKSRSEGAPLPLARSRLDSVARRPLRERSSRRFPAGAFKSLSSCRRGAGPGSPPMASARATPPLLPYFPADLNSRQACS